MIILIRDITLHFRTFELNFRTHAQIVKLSNLACIKGVKGIRARHYHNAGIDTIEKTASWNPNNMKMFLVQWVEHTGFKEIASLLKKI
jgi:hypothetical protein